MNELIEFLTSKEIIVVYIVAAIACLLCFIIYLVDKNYYKRKQRHNTRELNKLVEEVNEIIEEDYEEVTPEVYNTPVLETIDDSSVYTAVKLPIPNAITEPVTKVVEFKPTVEEPVIEEIEEKEVVESFEVEELEPINVEDIVLETMQEPVVEIEPIIEEMQKEVVEEQEELLYTSIEPNRQQAQEELMRLTEELEKAEQEQRNIDLTAYEEEQEENAIISLDELVRKSKEMYESNEITQYADEGNEPISLADLERRMKQIKEDIATLEEEPVTTETITPAIEPQIIETITEEIPQQMVLDDFNTIKIESEILPEIDLLDETKQEQTIPTYQAYQTTKKFERSPVISPIYGIERKETQEELELENTANYDKLDEEIKKTNEFLMTLKELQKNLD